MKKGFTLIELLVVIAIIALLSATLLTSMTAAKAKGQDGRRSKDLIQLRNALEIFASKNNGLYPSRPYNSRGGSANLPYTVDCNTGAAKNWDVAFLNYVGVIPVDPTNDSTHCYVYVPNSNYKGGGFYVLNESISNPAIQVTVVGSPDYATYADGIPKGYLVSDLLPSGSVIVLGTGESATTSVQVEEP
ncbi:MAG: type II secretion system protein [Candidatus Taylorbacteria bacterium]|nr:type II secretion system protein [Candidatus Taylorbacteria bacterium]